MTASTPFERETFASWGDMDFNAHMRNTAYLDKAADVRLQYFAACGFPLKELQRLRIGPVTLKDEVEYRREFRLHEPILVRLDLAQRKLVAPPAYLLEALLDLRRSEDFCELPDSSPQTA